jgi:Domain of unknown function (DUF4177)
VTAIPPPPPEPEPASEPGEPSYGWWRASDGKWYWPRWEYQVLNLSLSDHWTAKAMQRELDNFLSRLSAMGQAGWELVTYQAVPVTGSTNVVNSYAYLAIFKRPIIP